MDAAILMHAIHWNYEKDVFPIADGITLCQAQSTPVWERYLDLCKSHGFSENSLLNYKTCLMVKGEVGSIGLHWSEPYSMVSKLSNVVALFCNSALGRTLLLTSIDEFRSCRDSPMLYQLKPQHRWLCEPGNLDYFKLVKIRSAVANFSEFLIDKSIEDYSTSHQNSRVYNAFLYYFFVWQATYLEQACLNLAIALESLFSPSSRGELSFKISLYLSRFISDDSQTQEEIFDIIRDFYTVRSTIVHGREPRLDHLKRSVRETFRIIGETLQKVLLNIEFITLFDSQSERNAFFRELLFNFSDNEVLSP